jgi:ring-1,2-phenylacetyl-CoA epoxidase subunit PaaE
MTPKFHKLTVKTVSKLIKDAVSIEFNVPKELESSFQYLAGQYLTLKTQIKNEEVRRSYSLCSAPSEGKWMVAVKQVENGIFSTYALKHLKKGDEIEVMNPMGNFQYAATPGQKKSIVLFAAGSGITPMMAILKTVLTDEKESDVTLFYGNKGFYSVIFREELEALKNAFIGRFRIIHLFSQEILGSSIQKGRIDREKTDALYKAFLKNQKIDAVYLCGPEQMILGVKESLVDFGVKSEKIHFELFHAGLKTEKKMAPVKSINAFDSQIEVIIDGDNIAFPLASDGLAILDAAQAAGADLPYACKGGVCCTCKARLLEGTVSMDVNYALEKDEVAAGYILCCQAHPTSKKVVVTFDE